MPDAPAGWPLPDALEPTIGETVRQIRGAIAPAEILEVVSAWATVDLDRSEREHAQREHAGDRGSATPASPPAGTDRPDDGILGARCRQLTFGRRRAILLEPSTEGRLAAALARRGEGWVAVYVVAAGADDATVASRLTTARVLLSVAADGPLGPERLVLGGSRDGPFVLVVAGP